MANEKRLIDANELTNLLNHTTMVAYPNLFPGLHAAVEIVDDSPTVDAVEVVRCRECVHWKPTGSKAGNSFSDMEYIGGCEFTNYYRRESDFCSHGELKEGAD